MAQRLYGMVKEHPGAGKTHDSPDLFPHIRFIAMDTAVGTEGLRLHEGTPVTAEPGIGVQGGTFGAECFAAVLFAAVNGDHQGDGLFFPLPLGLGGFG